MFKEENMPKYLNEGEAKSILNKKSIELALTRYMDIEEKIEEKNKHNIWDRIWTVHTEYSISLENSS